MRLLRAPALLVIAVTVLLAPLCGQTGANRLTTIQPFQSNNGGLANGAVYFDLTTTATIDVTDLVLNYDDAAIGSPVGVEVHVTPGTAFGNETNPGVWSPVGIGAGTMAGVNARTVCTLFSPIVFPPGSYGVALVATGGAAHDYTNGTATNRVWRDALVTLQLGTATDRPFRGIVYGPRVANLELCYNPPGHARARRIGVGCGAGEPSSVYEQFTGGNDLGGAGLRASWTGSTYVLSNAAGILVPPLGASLAMGDDETRRIALPWAMPTEAGLVHEVWVCSNGWVSFEPTTDVGLSENVPDLLAGPTRIAVMWDDLDPPAGGNVHAEPDASDPGLFHITWNGVLEFGQTTPNTAQLTLAQSGDFRLDYGAVSMLDGIAGYSPGHGARDPGPTDFTAVVGTIALGDDRPPVTLHARNRPVLGTVAELVTTSLPPTAISGVQLYSLVATPRPGYALDGIGMPGCFLHQAGEIAFSFAVPPGRTAVFHRTIVPPDGSLAGALLFSQSVLIAPGANPLGVVTSNGIEWRFDWR